MLTDTAELRHELASTGEALAHTVEGLGRKVGAALPPVSSVRSTHRSTKKRRRAGPSRGLVITGALLLFGAAFMIRRARSVEVPPAPDFS